MDLTVSKVTINDAVTVFNLLRDSALWLRERGIDYWQNWLAPPPGHVKWVQSGLELGEYHLVKQGDEVVGCFRLQWSDPMFWGNRQEAAGYLHSFTVKRTLAGRGLGMQLLSIAEAICRENGKDRLRLDCGDVAGLRRYYEAAGFKSVGETVVGGHRQILYEKPLNAGLAG